LKVAGSRWLSSKGKGKQKIVNTPDSASTRGKCRCATADDLQLVKKQRGCSFRAANYSNEDIDALFNLLKEHVPLGGRG
jgi:hypothetical protein